MQTIDLVAQTAPYRIPSAMRSTLQLVLDVIGLIACEGAAYAALDRMPLLSIPFSLLAAGFLVRLFIIQHDCGHGSFYEDARWNDAVGTVIGCLMLTPYYAWRRAHAYHHASTGDLERRGVGDIGTLTVAEYKALSPMQQLGYRLFRNPLVLCIGGVFFCFFGTQRIPTSFLRGEVLDRRETRNVHWTSLFGVGLFVVLGLIDWRLALLLHLPIAILACAAGIFLFYVQHQFEQPYWSKKPDWSYERAAIDGSSFLDLPPLLRFFSGHIGYHHIHHLAPKVPNYNLKRCYDENACFHDVTRLTLWDALKTFRLKLYDEASGRMVGFDAVR